MALLDRARMTVSGNPGTGAVTLGTRVNGHQSLATAGAAAGVQYSYAIDEGLDTWEIGVGTFVGNGTFTRDTVTAGSNGPGVKVSFTSAAVITMTALAQNFLTDLFKVGEVRTAANNPDPTKYVSASGLVLSQAAWPEGFSLFGVSPNLPRSYAGVPSPAYPIADNISPTGYFRDIEGSGSTMITISDRGGIFRSADRGASWTEVKAEVANTIGLYAVCTDGAGKWLVVGGPPNGGAGGGGTIVVGFFSTNDGVSWTAIPTNAGLFFNSVTGTAKWCAWSPVDAQWVVGCDDAGQIIASPNPLTASSFTLVRSTGAGQIRAYASYANSRWWFADGNATPAGSIFGAVTAVSPAVPMKEVVWNGSGYSAICGTTNVYTSDTGNPGSWTSRLYVVNNIVGIAVRPTANNIVAISYDGAGTIYGTTGPNDYTTWTQSPAACPPAPFANSYTSGYIEKNIRAVKRIGSNIYFIFPERKNILVWANTDEYSPCWTYAIRTAGGGTASFLIGTALHNGSGTIVATSNDPSDGGTHYVRSSDYGSTWSRRAINVSLCGISASCMGPSGRLVVAGVKGVAYSDDAGLTWVKKDCPAPAAASMCWTGSLYVIGTTNGAIYTSPDLITWTSRTVPAPTNGSIVGLTSNDSGTVVLVVNNATTNAIKRSTDHGASWSNSASLSVASVAIRNAVYWTGQEFLIGQSNQLIGSPDGGVTPFSPVSGASTSAFTSITGQLSSSGGRELIAMLANGSAARFNTINAKPWSVDGLSVSSSGPPVVVPVGNLRSVFVGNISEVNTLNSNAFGIYDTTGLNSTTHFFGPDLILTNGSNRPIVTPFVKMAS